MMRSVNWLQLKRVFSEQIGSMGISADVTLHDGGVPFCVSVVRRRAPTENLTDGLQQNGERVSVMADPWLDNARRAPQKGDQLTIDNHRYAIQTAKPVYGGETLIGYTLTVLG